MHRRPPPSRAGRQPTDDAALLTVFISLLVVLGGATARPLPAQTAPAEPTRIAPREDLDFDRPESWGMAYFGSLLLMTGFGPAEAPGAGAVELGLEGGWVPRLDAEERRIGFIGSKEEDVNRTDAVGGCGPPSACPAP